MKGYRSVNTKKCTYPEIPFIYIPESSLVIIPSFIETVGAVKSSRSCLNDLKIMKTENKISNKMF